MVVVGSPPMYQDADEEDETYENWYSKTERNS